MATTKEIATTAEIPTQLERHQIAPEHDFIIVLKEVKPRTGNDGKQFMLVHEFEVAAAIMCKYKHFEVVSSSKQWPNTGKDTFEIKGDSLPALEIWLRLLHGCLDKTKLGASISTIWNLLVLAQKYNFDGHCPELKDWFFAWYAENIATRGTIGEVTCRELLYPCYFFDHAPGFAAVTKHLAYNMRGHIEEHMPAGVDPIHKEHHMKNNRVIGKANHRTSALISKSLTLPLGSLNGARGSLRTKLHSRLYDPCYSLLGWATCRIKEKVFYQYHKALKETGAWPLEIQGYRHSIIELLRLLRKFKYEDPHLEGGEACEKPLECMNGPKFSKLVVEAIAHVDDQFDGLCLGKNLALSSLLTQLTRYRLHERLWRQR